MTADRLLHEVLSDPLLGSYAVIIIDDVQLRSASTDLILGLLRKVSFDANAIETLPLLRHQSWGAPINMQYTTKCANV
jgi:hypothetical protein